MLEPKYYAGIGSRKTPESILEIMRNIASELETHSYILRSGGAIGADTAFESACTNKEIFLAEDAIKDQSIINFLSKYRPHFSKMKNEYIINLQIRSVYQILGKERDTPVEFVVCWTPDGSETYEELLSHNWSDGGTGTAIMVANLFEIPVFNLQKEDALERLVAFVDTKI